MNNEVRQETLNLLFRYGKKWAEINTLQHIWFYMHYGVEYNTDYEKSLNLNNMYKSAPMFFSISRIAIERTSRVELIKLFEGNDKATMKYLREHLDKVSDRVFEDSAKSNALLELNKGFQCNVKKYIETIDALKKIRNKHLAHNDLSYFNDPSEIYKENEVLIDNVFTIIKIVGEFLDDVGLLFNASVCPKYSEIMDIESLEMYFRE